MRFFSTILALAGASYVSANRGSCMNNAAAQQVADNFGSLIADLDPALARAALASDFSDYTDSVATLINGGCPGPRALGQVTIPTKKKFIRQQGAQDPIPFNQLNMWHTCDTVVIRWSTLPTDDATELVTGIIVLETVKAPEGSEYPYLIQTAYSEFNSGAWLVDTGVFTPSCS